VTELIEELDAAGCEALGLTPDPGTVPRLQAYARSVASFPTAVKEARSNCLRTPAQPPDHNLSQPGTVVDAMCDHRICQTLQHRCACYVLI